MHEALRNLLPRMADVPGGKDLREASKACFSVVEAFEARAGQIKSDPRLTEAGRADALRDEAVKTALPALNLAQAPIADATHKAQERRRSIAVPVPDRNDLAGAMERQEIRAMLRSMGDLARVAFVMESSDERVEDAVLTAPASLSGMTKDQWALVNKIVLDRRYGAEMANVQAIEGAVEAASAAYETALDMVRSAAGVDERAFGTMRREISGTPWLVKSDDRILRVLPGQSTYPLATAEEIATGKYYATEDEFLADNPGAAMLKIPSAA